MIFAYPVRELRRFDADGPDGIIEPGCMVGADMGRLVDWDDNDPPDTVVDPGLGIVVAVIDDEHNPGSPGPGLVATVIWAREPTVDGLRLVQVPYVPRVRQPRYEFKSGEIKKRRYPMMGRLFDALRGKKDDR